MGYGHPCVTPPTEAWKKQLTEITNTSRNELKRVTVKNFRGLNIDIASTLASLIAELKSLESIVICNSNIDDCLLAILAPALFSSSRSITSVDLSDNDITGSGLLNIHRSLGPQSALDTLDVSSNPCRDGGGIRLLERQINDFICTFDEDDS